jgi:hypothetical protein
MYRVTRPGGRVVICEFSHPTWAPLRTVYTEYLMRALPPVARAVSSSPDAYVYLAESIRAWPDQPALAGRLGEAGWSRVAWRNLSGGIAATLLRTNSGDQMRHGGHSTRMRGTPRLYDAQAGSVAVAASTTSTIPRRWPPRRLRSRPGRSAQGAITVPDPGTGFCSPFIRGGASERLT